MRQPLSFSCEADRLAATIDEAVGTTGLLLVTGGSQIRVGAHRGMAMLAARVAEAGYPAFRFDRRGIGDSGGADPGFRGSAPDIAAAAQTFRSRCPAVTRLIGFGLCDGATALALHHRAAGIDGLVLANPWVVEAAAGVPPPAAIRRRYVERLGSAEAWRRLLRGEIDLGKAARGLRAAARIAPQALAGEVAGALTAGELPIRILLAAGDATAIAFAAEFQGSSFAALRRTARARTVTLDSRAHSFASAVDADWLAANVIAALGEFERK